MNGGLDHAVESVFGASTVWVSDIDKGANKILAHRYPDVPNLGDVSTVDWTAVGPVDILTGGTPCQDLSHAGKRAGMSEGTRSNLWVMMREGIAQLEPDLVVWENVRGAYSADADSDLEHCEGCMGARRPDVVLRALGRVLGDLSDLGYDCRWHGLRAADVGACHGRFRVFVVATRRGVRHPSGGGHGEPLAGRGRRGRPEEQVGDSGDAAADAELVHRGQRGEPRPGEEAGGWTPAVDHGRRGASADDRVILLPTPVTDPDSGNGHARDLRTETLLPTPSAADGEGPGRHSSKGHQKTLPGEARLLPTPSAAAASGGQATRGGDRADEPLLGGALLPTPRATDGEKGGPNQRGSSGDLMLPSAVLLPTPTRREWKDHEVRREPHRPDDRDTLSRALAFDDDELLPTPRATRGGSGTETMYELGAERSDEHRPQGQVLLSAKAETFGQYAAAVARWEQVLGREAPPPTEPTGRGGAHRLSARFVEWMMGLPDGWITDVPDMSRNECLKACGNGVVPLQAEAAIRYMLSWGVR